MTIITGTSSDDPLIVNSETTSVQAKSGTDTAVFSGSYADYTFSQSDSYVSLITHNTTGQVVSLFGVEQLQFDDSIVNLPASSNGEFQVNTHTSSNQDKTSTTALADGGFVVTWYSNGQDGNGLGIYAQRYDADGNTQGLEFQVNTYTSSHQSNPSTTALADGGFVVTWQSYGQDGSDSGIYAQRYDVSGNTQGSEFQVNTYTSSGQYSPSITALADGGFVVAWNGLGGGDSSNIYAQRYDADGNTQGSEFQINTYTLDGQYYPSTTALADGGFVVTWQSNGQDGSDDGIYAQRYDADGNTQGLEFQVNTYTADSQTKPSTTALADGGFVVTWMSYGQDGSSYGIYAQRYDASGTVAGDEFQVNTYTIENQYNPSITSLADGGFVVAWNGLGGGDSSNIYAQRYDASASAVGNEFQVNTYTSNSQESPSITALNDGGFVITWSSNGQDDADGSSGVYAQRYDSEGSLLGEIIFPTTMTMDYNTVIFEMIDPTGNVIPGADDVNGSITIDIATGAGTATVASSQNFNGFPWVAHDVTVQANADMTAATFNMLIDWNGNNNIPVVLETKITLNADVTLTFSALDLDGDGILGNPMASGPFAGFSAVFSGTVYPEGTAPAYVATAPTMNIITGTSGDDNLTVSTSTNSVQASSGIDTVIFSGNYTDYSFDQSDSYVPLVTHNTTAQMVSLFGVEKLQFDDGVVNLSTNDNGEFQVNTHTSLDQDHPSVTALADGGFVVTWQSSNQDGSSNGIYAQRYDTGGNVVGPELQVNTWTLMSQNNPSLTTLTDGGFVVTWHGMGGDYSQYRADDSQGIYVQRYDSNGNAVGVEFQVNTYTSDTQQYPSITALTDGGFVVTWESDGQDGSSWGIYAQRYDVSGNTLGSEFQINTYTTDSQAKPSTTALADGSFVVTWTSNGQDGDAGGIYAQRYDVNSDTLGSEFQINTYAEHQDTPSITALADGGFVVVWESDDQDLSSTGIFAKRYDSNGNVAGDEFQVNTYTSNSQNSPSITALNDGGFVITWSSNDQDDVDGSSGIYAQRYDSNGNVVGDEFQVNTYASNSQNSPSTTALADGGFVVTWTSNGQDDSGKSIHAQRYDSEGNSLGEVTFSEITTPTATIQTDITNYLDNVTLHYYKDGVDTGVSTLVENGEITFPNTDLEFDSVKLSDPAAYTTNLYSIDAVTILKDVVFLDIIEPGSVAWHAADANNDGAIRASDAVAILKHIVHLDTLDTFDLVDNITGNRVTSLDTNAINIGQWSIVANGDVDQGGGFVDGYTIALDVV